MPSDTRNIYVFFCAWLVGIGMGIDWDWLFDGGLASVKVKDKKCISGGSKGRKGEKRVNSEREQTPYPNKLDSGAVLSRDLP